MEGDIFNELSRSSNKAIFQMLQTLWNTLWY